jgi:4,5-DOPA dioxygenase extradiol
LAAAAGDTAHVLVDGYAMGSLSMTSYTLGCHQLEPDCAGGAPALPPIPGDETNV